MTRRLLSSSCGLFAVIFDRKYTILSPLRSFEWRVVHVNDILTRVRTVRQEGEVTLWTFVGVVTLRPTLVAGNLFDGFRR